MSKRIFETELMGRKLVLETGELAQFANGSVLVRYGDTTVLSTATAAEPREGIDFFPLSVDYEEKMYAIGKIPGGFLRREGKPSEKAILVSRSIDRPLRPLFPKDMRNDVYINNLVMAVDQDNAPEIAAMIGSSVAVAISDIPWNGPVAAVQVGIVDGEIIVCPNLEQSEKSDLQLTVAGSEEKVCMIEAGANEIPDEQMLEAIIAGHKEIQKLCRFIKEIVAEIGKPKFSYTSFALPEEVFTVVKDFAYDEMWQTVQEADKATRDQNVSVLRDKIRVMLSEKNPEWTAYTGEAVDLLEKKVVRALLKEHKRVDGRAMDEIRPLSAAVDIIPRVHGSACFQRGSTQVVSIATLGTLANAQKLDSIDPVVEKRYMHQYNFPGYSVGEAKASRSPGRREIGHGALAERALLPVLPSPEEFPYAIRVVSEVTMSNGSTSQGSICGSTLALMAAGVPIKEPVAGISSGLITADGDTSQYEVFMDIQGIEDFFGDMDFKVGGTRNGITAIQVDIKVDGLTYDIIRDAFAMTHKGRMQILDEVIKPVIAEPRKELSPWAPKIEQIDIPADKIREVIGSGGKNIKRITDESKCDIDIVEDGSTGHVFIASPDSEAAEKAIAMIRAIAYDPEPGSVFDGVVTRLMNFGAFVEFAPGKEGLVHISKMSWDRVDRVEDVVEPGQNVRVIVTEIDSQGRVNLSMRDLMEKPEGWAEERRESRDQGGSYGERRERRDSFRGDRGERGGRERRPRRDDRRNDRYGRDDRGGRRDEREDRGERRERSSFVERREGRQDERSHYSSRSERNTSFFDDEEDGREKNTREF